MEGFIAGKGPSGLELEPKIDLEWAPLGGSTSGPVLAGLGSRLWIGLRFVPYAFTLGPRWKRRCFYADTLFSRASLG